MLHRLFPSWLLLPSAVIVLVVTACRHDPFMPDGSDPVEPVDTTGNPVDTMMNGEPCDPDVVYFELDVLPILRSNCALSGCHDATSAQDDVVLTDFTRVVQTADVEAFDLDGSDLYEVITENDSDDRMPPPPNTPLTPGQINIIAKWIQQGARDLSCDPNVGGCDTDMVTYSGTVAPLLQNTCVGCHGGGSPSAGVNLSSHAGVAQVALNGRLLGAIRWEAGYAPMPQGGNQLSDCTIDQIAAWVDAGAPNN